MIVQTIKNSTVKISYPKQKNPNIPQIIVAAPVQGESTVVADPVLGESFFSGGSSHLGVELKTCILTNMYILIQSLNQYIL